MRDKIYIAKSFVYHPRIFAYTQNLISAWKTNKNFFNLNRGKRKIKHDDNHMAYAYQTYTLDL